ncbi:MAG: PQQ-binding-like beta-propeller repeat protein [Phycisphaerae bacterium]
MARAMPAASSLRAGIPSAAALLFATFAAVGATGRGDEGDVAKQVLAATGVRRGLIVHLGCGDGKVTAGLYAGEGQLVHGLDADAGNVARAREHIRSLGIYGPVSVDRFDAKRLPYVGGLVNLLVAEDMGDVPVAEAMRVLAPGGALYARQDGPLDGAGGRRWTKTVKPRPGNTDEWTHFLHDASGNAVAHDDVVGPPRHVQWIAAPRHARSHEHTPSINALVSAAGRIFYIADEGAIGSLRQSPRWHLVARDAYNGILLWKRAFSPWFPHILNWGATPQQLQRRLIAVGDRVYVTLGLHAPLSAVDAATGKTLKAYERTRGTEEVVSHKGVLLLLVRGVTDERVAELEKWARLAKQSKSPLYVRETAEPLLKQFRAIEGKAGREVHAVDADTGRLLWKKAGPDAAGLRTGSLCASGDRVFYQRGRDVVCLDLRTGRQRWSAPSAALRVVCDSHVVCAGEAVTALSAETGKALWTQPASLCQIRDAFIINGSLWLGGFKPWQGKSKGKRGPAWGPYFATQRDLATGKMLKQVEPENPGHHHRCWQNKATDRYILGGRRGVEFIDLQSGDVLWHSWVRGVCKYGVMPCNGLLYAPPHACGCYIAAKLTGFHALAPASAATPAGRPTTPLPEKGPAYGGIRNPQSAIRNSDDWPTYRHDPGRSGCTRSPVPGVLRRRWQADVGGKLTSVTVAGGKVFVASVDEHRISAIDADSGRSAWHFTAGARVDSPPTLHGGRAIFGCRDGYVYSLRASDGALAWRLRAARAERLVTACGQLESASPVHGSVLVQDGVAYLTAGRSSYLDGGIDLHRVQPATGEALSRTPFYSPDPETGKQPKHYGPCNMPGAIGDILTGDGRHVYLRDAIYDSQGRSQPKGDPHLFTLTGFLDASWPHRSYWIFGTRCSISTGCSGRDRNLIYGRLLVFDESTICGYGRANVHWSNQLQDGPYRLFAVNRGDGTQRWAGPVTIRARAMLLADKVLFAAGPAADSDYGPEGRDEKQPALLVAVSASDGTELARYQLDSSPVFDGMAAAGGRLYIPLESGQVICMDEKPAPER